MRKIVLFGVLLLAALTVHAADLQCNVIDITADYGNIDTDATFEQLQELGFEPGDKFVVKFKDHQVTALFSSTYGDVPRGEWVGLFTDQLMLRIARNFENAATTLGIAKGDSLTIAPVPLSNPQEGKD